LIQKSNLKKVNIESINNSLRKVKENSVLRANVLMKKNDETTSKYSRGKQMAFYAMQLMNADLCLKILEEI
jgi:hypothetical protein